MKKRMQKILRGETATSVFYILFGVCMIAMPVQSVNLICKVVFGLVLIAAGGYHIYHYVEEQEKATILDLFSGVIVLVLGGFLFFTPQVVVKLLPLLLGALILVDSIWILRGSYRLKQRSREEWKILLVGGLVFVALGVLLFVSPFKKIEHNVVFAGWVFLANGVSDLVLLVFLKKAMKLAEENGENPEANKAEPPQLFDESAQAKQDAAEDKMKKGQPETAEEQKPEEPTEEEQKQKNPEEDGSAEIQGQKNDPPEEVQKPENSSPEEIKKQEKDDPEETPEKEERTKPQEKSGESAGSSFLGFDDDEPLEEWKD